jgi:hypothetical protein
MLGKGCDAMMHIVSQIYSGQRTGSTNKLTTIMSKIIGTPILI